MPRPARAFNRRASLALSVTAALGLGLCPLGSATAQAPQPSDSISVPVANAAPGANAFAGAQHGWIPAKEFTEADGLRGDITLQEAARVGKPLQADGSLIDTPATEQLPALKSDLAFSGEGQKAVWSGRVDPSREVQLLAYNTDTDRYEVLGSSRGEADRTIRVEGALKDQHNLDGKAKIIVLGTDPFADDLNAPVKNSFEDPSEYDFSLVHLTDTQYLTEGATQKLNAKEREVWADAYIDSYRWVAENKDSKKIKFVAHTGDITENWHEVNLIRSVAEKEFAFADRAQKVLEDTGIPHAVVAGNHDNRSGRDVGSNSLYNETFGPSRYESLDDSAAWKEAGADYHSWKPGDNDNSYTLFSAGGQDFITVNLSYDVTQEEADWAARVLDQYSTRNAIVLTHAYRKPSDQPDGRGGDFSHDGQIINDRVLERSPNVALVLSGHEHGVSIGVRKDVGEPGNNVTELLADYQFYKVSAEELGLDEISWYSPTWRLRFGASFFRLLQFDLDKGEVAIDTYSAHLNNFGATEYDTKSRYNGHEDDLRLPVQFHGRTTAFSTDALRVE